MAEDPLLKALTDTAKDTDPSADPRWEALAEGTLSAEDEADLAALARTSERHRALYEAFRPLDDAARSRIAASLIRAVPRASPPPARVVPMRRRWTWMLAAAAVLAGGIWLAVGRPHDDGLPRYAMAVTAGERDVRAIPSADVEAPRLGPGSRLTIVLRPATAVRGAVATRAFLLQNGRARAWDVPVETAESGALRIEGAREALFAGVPAGRWEVLVAVARPGALPSAEDAAAIAAGKPAPEGCQLIRREVVLVDGGP